MELISSWTPEKFLGLSKKVITILDDFGIGDGGVFGEFFGGVVARWIRFDVFPGTSAPIWLEELAIAPFLAGVRGRKHRTDVVESFCGLGKLLHIVVRCKARQKDGGGSPLDERTTSVPHWISCRSHPRGRSAGSYIVQADMVGATPAKKLISCSSRTRAYSQFQPFRDNLPVLIFFGCASAKNRLSPDVM